MSHLSSEVFKEAKAHAIQAYPEEACGLVVDGQYMRSYNYALPSEQHTGYPNCECRKCSFSIAPEEIVKAGNRLDAILHSHPDGPFYPSQSDMEGQLHTNVPWGIIATDGERASDPVMWGDTLEIAPLVGREFMHGVHDCYSLIRDTFRLGKDELARLDITSEWPFDPIILNECPRNESWWETQDDLYQDMFEKEGFRVIQKSEVRPGDCFMTNIRSKKINHAGIYIGNNLLLHHLPSRPSRREPAGIWARHAAMWVRHEAADA
ncbi:MULTISPECIES: Mov34/MPN/PAD-1 family protein [unclassified Pseudovibrio]|uniref:Mov34/MPN/PAD-1 family protein n=1 Tax=unclassified Pseudovibrio TaxID=2627060 RepID=UPI0007AE9C12|nr:MULTISPECIES: Mov34/MPN/PAD-1 family protein [unclassified Pseudovibrio]KZK92568.1 NlpC/P60 family protein [Pseudovibrio sp. W74]KZL10388.1 NlpC/P60 family protein [Pseudovibrio sp. Ad14]